MIITLYADASFCPYTHAAGLGYWARWTDFRRIRGGVSALGAANSEEAEAEAIHRGFIENLQIMLDWQKAQHKVASDSVAPAMFVIKSDCLNVVELLKYRSTRNPRSALLQRIRDDLDELCEQHAIYRKVRWVKGHAGGDTTESYLNEQVDAIARKHMLRERERRRRPYQKPAQ